MANHLDKLGLKKEADYIDGMIRKTAGPIILTPEILYQLREEGTLPEGLQSLSDKDFEELIFQLRAMAPYKGTWEKYTGREYGYQDMINRDLGG